MAEVSISRRASVGSAASRARTDSTASSALLVIPVSAMTNSASNPTLSGRAIPA